MFFQEILKFFGLMLGYFFNLMIVLVVFLVFLDALKAKEYTMAGWVGLFFIIATSWTVYLIRDGLKKIRK